MFVFGLNKYMKILPYFVKNFLRLDYINKTKNTFIRSLTVKEIMRGEKIGVYLWLHVLYVLSVMRHIAQARV
jgi:hypothetical protein